MLPEDVHPVYRVAILENSPSFAARRLEKYVLKTDPRYVISCGIFADGRGNGKTIERCGMDVPYREFTGTHCAQLHIGFPKREMAHWAELAQRKRDVIRQFEVHPKQTKSQERK